MESQDKIVLTKHRLKHIPELTVSKEFFKPAFASGCSMMSCNAKCCHGGVWADLKEMENILAHSDMIKKHMEPQQEHDTSKWFDGEVVEDTDFPSGKATGTQTRANGCVFLKTNGHCVLQSAAVAEGMSKFAIKPYFCFAFPVALEEGELVMDDPDFTWRTECCATVQNGTMTVMEVCAEELEFMLGLEGFEELKEKSKIAFE